MLLDRVVPSIVAFAKLVFRMINLNFKVLMCHKGKSITLDILDCRSITCIFRAIFALVCNDSSAFSIVKRHFISCMIESISLLFHNFLYSTFWIRASICLHVNCLAFCFHFKTYRRDNDI